MHIGMHHHHDYHGMSLAQRNLLLALPRIPLNAGEGVLLQSHAKYRVFPQGKALEPSIVSNGGLVLTDRRLIYYFFDFSPENPLKYDIVFDCPLGAISRVEYRSPYGESCLEVFTNTDRLSGPPYHEFVLIGAKDCCEYIRKRIGTEVPQQDRSNEDSGNKYHQEPVSIGPAKMSSESEQQDRRFKKVCLSCMGTIPESSSVCPRCGASQ